MKDCIECGKELIKRKYESKKRFGKKQFCSSKCSRAYMKRNKMGWWSKDSKKEIAYGGDYTWL